MPFSITTTVEAYLLPQDGPAAESTFLGHLSDPHEMYIIAYAFTLQQMIDTFIKDAPDPNLHIYLDSTQASGTYEKPALQKLVDAGIEVTIGTSTAGTKFICHTKGIVCNDVPSAWCWEGSTNFSASAWSQVNTAMVFNSQEYYDAFVRQFLNLRYFAWTTERNLQIMKNPPPGALNPPPAMGNTANSTAAAVIAGTADSPNAPTPAPAVAVHPAHPAHLARPARPAPKKRPTHKVPKGPKKPARRRAGARKQKKR